jgi:hypothetical protein
VVARTESAFHDIAVGRHVVHAALSAGRIFRLEAEEWSPTLVTQFEMAGAATLEQVPSGGFLALTQTLDGVVHVAPDGTSRSVADVGVAASPLVIPINSGIVAQRTSPDGRTQIIRIPDTGEPELVLAGGAEGELELLDARDKGILFRRKLDGTTRVISYVSTKGGNILDLIRGPIDGPARWTQLGIVYSTEETNDNGLPVTRLREATAGLGSQLLEATDGRFLFDGVTSLYSSGRRLFITTDTGLLFRQTFRPRQP